MTKEQKMTVETSAKEWKRKTAHEQVRGGLESDLPCLTHSVHSCTNMIRKWDGLPYTQVHTDKETVYICVHLDSSTWCNAEK